MRRTIARHTTAPTFGPQDAASEGIAGRTHGGKWQAAEDAEYREIDLRVLRVIAERPEMATSQSRIRLAAGLQNNLVCAAIGRLIGQRWIEPPARQRQPYTVTEDGRTALNGAK